MLTAGRARWFVIDKRTTREGGGARIYFTSVMFRFISYFYSYLCFILSTSMRTLLPPITNPTLFYLLSLFLLVSEMNKY